MKQISKLRIVVQSVILTALIALPMQAQACHTCPGYEGCHGWCPYPGDTISQQGLAEIDEQLKTAQASGLSQLSSSPNGGCEETCSAVEKEACGSFSKCVVRATHNPDTNHIDCGYECD